MNSMAAAPAQLRGPISAASRRAPLQGAWMSACLHLLALVALCTVVVPRHLPEPPPPPSFAVVVAAPPAPAPATEERLQAAELSQPRQPVMQALAAPMPVSLAPSVHAELHVSRRVRIVAPAVPAPAADAAAAPRIAAAPAVARAAPAPATPLRDVLTGLEARIRQAVQDAAVYPASARVMRLEGRTQVRFDYTDGSVGGADVAMSSNSPMLDRAAVAAVRRAALPRAPAEIGGRRLPLLVWVDFRLVRQD